MQRPLLIITLVLLGLGAGAFFVFQAWEKPQEVSPDVVAGDPGDLPAVDEGEVLGESDVVDTQTPNLTSLPALMKKQFDGRDLTLARILEDNASYTRHFVTYKSGDLTISGIMNIPKGQGPFPVLILNHGYIDRSVYTNGRGLRREQDYLARQGFAVLHPDYRCHAQSDCEEPNEIVLRLGYVEDAINAVEAIKQSDLPQLDDTRIGMLGHSMGGGVTQNVLVAQPDLLGAAVLFAPVSSDIRDSVERWTSRHPDVMQKVMDAYGSLEENPTFWQNLSARTFFDRVETPVVIHHGTADASVPLGWSETTRDALQAAGKDVVLDIYPDQPHEFTSSWGLVMQRTTSFFRDRLGAT